MNISDIFADLQQELHEETLSAAFSSFVEEVNNQVNP